MKIILSTDDIKRAVFFSNKIAPHFVKRKFSDDKMRTLDKIQKDIFIGRLGELAFLRYLEKEEILVRIGREVLPVGMWDIDDVCYRGWSFDVKCTERTEPELLLNYNKIDYRHQVGELPHYYVVARLKKHLLNPAEYLTSQENITVELQGFLDSRKLKIDDYGNFIILKGIKNEDGILHIPYTELSTEWNVLIDALKNKKPFIVNKEDTETYTYKDRPIKYSLCLSGKEAEGYSSAEGIKQLAYLLENGIKIKIFLPDNKKNMFKALLETFKSNKPTLNLFYFYKSDEKIPSMKIIDGHVKNEDLQKIQKSAPDFNSEQFAVEHFTTKQHLLVTAGAGTGKTAVMVDRVLYLLATVPDLKLSDIAMITFTRDAAKNMRDRIATALTERFRQTGQYHYLEWMEQLGDMQISTIDSFFKKIISKEGQALGYGSGVRIRGMIHEKKKILQDVMNKTFPVKDGRKNILDKIVLPDYEYEKLVMSCWDKLDSWGVYLDSIKDMDFGQGVGKEDNKINYYLPILLKSAETQYRQVKKRMNSLSVNDLKEDLDQLSQCDISRISGMNYKFLFIDEFQDTDSSQINTLIWLSKILHCQLFVVGDIKQSIYRFRGAEATAFNQLENTLKNKQYSMIAKRSLVKNYRTAANVLNSLNSMFGQWDLIEAEPVEACARGKDGTKKRGIIECISYKNSKNNMLLQQKTISLIRCLLDERKGKGIASNKENDHSNAICILNRTNYQVQETALWCQSAGIPVAAIMEGGFYQCRAVQDIAALLRALLYPEDTRAVFNFLMSSYAAVQPDIDKIRMYAGQEEALSKYLGEVAEASHWQEILHASRRKSFFQLIRKIIQFCKPAVRFRDLRRQELQGCYKDAELNKQIDIDTKSYELNLNKLLKLFYDSFRQDFASLLSVYDFLILKQNTERKEDELTAQPDGDYVLSMTVHKSKGLEYDTVIIPMTTKPFYNNPEENDNPRDGFEFLLSRTTPYKFGWRMMLHGTTYKNSVFEEELVNDIYDNAKEEARILYVALTRVKNKLYYFIPQKIPKNTWAELLSYGNNTDGDNDS